MASELDIAIIGAGISGAYCAYRLRTSRPDLRVAVFEASDRVGGRLKSLEMAPGAIAELGGAFVSSLHRNIVGLMPRLGLELLPLRWQRRGLYIGGRRASDANLADDASPFNLWPEERGKAPFALLAQALAAIAPGYDQIWPISHDAAPGDAYARLQSISFAGRPLRDWPFQDLLQQVLSPDAVTLLATTMGSTANFGPYCALDALRTLQFELAPQRAYIVKQGYEAAPRRLLELSNVSVHLNHKLEEIEGSSGAFSLSFTERAPVSAGAVIAALPPAALSRVRFDRALADHLGRNLDRVDEVAAFKLYMTFAQRWWPDVAAGESERGIAAAHTDLPIQQCYLEDARSNEPALCLAAFAEGHRAAYWRDLDPDRSAALALKQLREMHPDIVIPQPDRVVMQNWTPAHEGAAWHAWKPGADSRAVGATLRRPSSGAPIHVCGEAFSTLQGWAEGAVNSAELVVQDCFGLDRAPWIAGDYVLDQ